MRKIFYDPSKVVLTHPFIASVFFLAHGGEFWPTYMNAFHLDDDAEPDEYFEEDEQIHASFEAHKWLFDYQGQYLLQGKNKWTWLQRLLKDGRMIDSDIRHVLDMLPYRPVWMVEVYGDDFWELGPFADFTQCYHNSPKEFGYMTWALDGSNMQYWGLALDEALEDRIGSFIESNPGGSAGDVLGGIFNAVSTNYVTCAYLNDLRYSANYCERHPNGDNRMTAYLIKADGLYAMHDLPNQQTTAVMSTESIQDFEAELDDWNRCTLSAPYPSDEEMASVAYCEDCEKVQRSADFIATELNETPTYKGTDHCLYYIGDKYICSCQIAPADLQALHQEAFDEFIWFSPAELDERKVEPVPKEQLPLPLQFA